MWSRYVVGNRLTRVQPRSYGMVKGYICDNTTLRTQCFRCYLIGFLKCLRMTESLSENMRRVAQSQPLESGPSKMANSSFAKQEQSVVSHNSCLILHILRRHF